MDALIGRMDTDFALVMITERMEESLVLLAEVLCLPLCAMAGLTVNARKDGLRKVLAPDKQRRLLELQAQEERLYAHFAGRFDAQVARFGRERMAAAVAELRRLDGVVRTEEEECARAGMVEPALMEEVRRTQERRWNR